MTTTKRRLNITLTPFLEEAIRILAKKDNVPEATKATELLKMAVEIEEDEYFLKLAEEREKKDVKYINEDKFWKSLDV